MKYTIYKKKLEQKGYEIVSACNGEDGYKMILKEKPNIALIDIIMPKKDGFELIKNIKSNEELKKMPIIILSNLDFPETRSKACQLGVLFYFLKNQCLPDQLAEVVGEILSVGEKNPEFLVKN